MKKKSLHFYGMINFGDKRTPLHRNGMAAIPKTKNDEQNNNKFCGILQKTLKIQSQGSSASMLTIFSA